MPQNHKLYNNASLNIVPRSKFNLLSESCLIPTFYFSFFSHSCLVICSLFRRTQRLLIFIVRNYPGKFNNFLLQTFLFFASRWIRRRIRWLRHLETLEFTLSALYEITTSSKRRCEYDITRQLAFFCTHVPSPAHFCEISNGGGFLASYY